MAATRIWSIKGRLDSVINYVTNPEKTDGGRYTDTELQALTDVIDYAEDEAKTHNKVYVSGINLSPNIARDQMVMTKLQFGKTDKILAYHGYQSFLPGEVTPDIAHEIGVKLAERLWGDRFQVLVTTHLDHEHIHNHFCLNSVSFVDGKKFRGGSKAYWVMRARNNRIMLRLNDKEHESLIKSSEKVGVPREVYLRMLIMGTTPKEKPTADFYGTMKELNAIGNSLNQIAKVANSKGFINVKAYEENVRKLNGFIIEIGKTVFTPERRDDKWLLQEFGL